MGVTKMSGHPVSRVVTPVRSGLSKAEIPARHASMRLVPAA